MYINLILPSNSEVQVCDGAFFEDKLSYLELEILKIESIKS